jgi:hypothetical protein
VSEDSGAKPAPLILDVSILIAVARGDVGVMSLLLGYDAEGQSLIIPVLAVTAASADMGSDEAAAALVGLGRLGNAMTAPLANLSQAVRACRSHIQDGTRPVGCPSGHDCRRLGLPDTHPGRREMGTAPKRP